MQRRIELDAARGAMLVWMTLTHLPTIISPSDSYRAQKVLSSCRHCLRAAFTFSQLNGMATEQWPNNYGCVRLGFIFITLRCSGSHLWSWRILPLVAIGRRCTTCSTFISPHPSKLSYTP